MLENLLASLINVVDGTTSKHIVFGITWIAQHYTDLLSIVRWTVPCVITSSVLFCLLVPTTELTE
jgi:hypothetical protein